MRPRLLGPALLGPGLSWERAMATTEVWDDVIAEIDSDGAPTPTSPTSASAPEPIWVRLCVLNVKESSM